jgi:hypothetical protein
MGIRKEMQETIQRLQEKELQRIFNEIMLIRSQWQTMQKELQNLWKEEKEKWKIFDVIMNEPINESDENLNFLKVMQNLLSNEQMQTRNANQMLLENTEIENRESHQNVMEMIEEHQKRIKECIINTIREAQYGQDNTKIMLEKLLMEGKEINSCAKIKKTSMKN